MITVDFQTETKSGSVELAKPDNMDDIDLSKVLQECQDSQFIILSVGEGDEQKVLLLSETLLHNPENHLMFFGNMMVTEKDS